MFWLPESKKKGLNNKKLSMEILEILGIFFPGNSNFLYIGHFF